MNVLAPSKLRKIRKTRFHTEQRKQGVKQRRVRFGDFNLQDWEGDALMLAILRSRGPLIEAELVAELNKAIVWLREVKMNAMLLMMLLHGKICGSVVDGEMIFKPLPKVHRCQSTQK